ncbi:MAG TPA: hypothetical protein VFQ07_06935 [Candidatus Polarisedimenticolia bacterium]|nr:hypothetical protein [Candidatus Polarisedimenticolia bacterium]
MSTGWKVALALACLGGVLALLNACLDYQRTGHLAYGKIALAFGVPILFYAIARSAGPAERA